MQHSDIVAEGSTETTHRLRSQADLRNQDDRTLSPLQHSPHCLEVHQRLAAAGHAEEQGSGARRQSFDLGKRCPLVRRERGGWSNGRAAGERIAHQLRLPHPGQAALDQPPNHGIGEPHLLREMAHRGPASQRFQRLVQLPLLGPALEQRIAFDESWPFTSQRKRAFGQASRVGIRGLNPESDGLHPAEPLDHVPEWPTERSGSGLDRTFSAALLQPGHHLTGQTAEAVTAILPERDDDLGFAPHAGGQNGLERQAQRCSVVPGHPFGSSEECW